MKKHFWYTNASLLLAIALVTSLATGCDSDDKKDEEQKDGGIKDGGADTGGQTTDTGNPDAGEPEVPLPATITTKDGPVCGQEMVDASGAPTGVMRYRGIPYAAPPVGDLRWKPPQPMAPWTTPPACDKWPDRAPQTEVSGTGEGLGEISEDCLHLNLMTPATQPEEKLPVMVWFHGGGFSIMSGNSELYCNHALPQQGVVVVSVNHRLGPFGYMAHPALTAESENKASGNYGTLDMIAALKWVQDNIAAFGGDPGNVTIFGQSGGGAKVVSLLASPLAKGLFHRAVVQSGSSGAMPQGTTSFEDAEAAGTRIANALGVDKEADVLAAMRAKSWQDVLAAAASSTVGYFPNINVDGWALLDTVYNILQNGKQNNVPLMVGACTGEGSEVRTSVPNLAAGMSSVSSNAYVYVFSHLPPAWKAEECVAFHSIELPYLFGDVVSGLAEATVITLAPRGGCTANDPGADATDEVVAQNTMSLWSQFAKTGNPSLPGTVEWPAYTASTDQYLEIGATLEVKTGVADAAIDPPIEQGEPVLYTNTDYSFSLSYPGSWVEKTTGLASGVIWRVGQGTYFVPSVRAMVHDEADGADLKTVFTKHLAEDGAKTISSFTEATVTADCTGCTQADVKYSSSTGTYDSTLLGLIKDGKWIILEVYTVPSFAPFADETQKASVVSSIKFE